MKILVINGVNLNFLGKREKSLYGDKTLDDIINNIKIKAQKYNYEILDFQSNIEGEIVNRIQQAYFEDINYIIFNPGAFTHYSIAIRDALLSVKIPTIEVHMTNVYKREEFRHISVISDIVIGKLTGFGDIGYLMAIEYIKEKEESIDGVY
ncbi:3-dehydroquinate dehydratase [Hypnocyclicus thermotrophus]|uniref:3-dehydroquinate dehydratase n=1 Tax=Hypnocyclicus thermotrophus TaxID=1627895 RepID=A0AA46DYA3_9FUSO|nr:type II 3-dehydroquinate dehydratase [Hypnocyclicus thermotrophus]TDT69145.1 3-dehydroquinate dehydratase [Hypnocyclicus thermotrophus]